MTRTEELVRDLLALARKTGAGNKLPTVRALCERQGVAMATVQAALGQLAREGVLRLEHGRGIFVAEGVSTRTLGILLGDEMAGGVPPFYSAMEAACRRLMTGAGGAVRTYGNRVREYEEAVRNGVVQAGLMLPETTAERGDWFEGLGIPSLCLSASGRPGTFGVDYHAMIRQGVSALAGEGARRIACVSLFNPVHEAAKGKLSPRVVDRAVFEAALAETGLSVRDARFLDNYLVFPDGSADFSGSGETAARILLRQGDRPHDGVLILDDQFAASFLPTMLLAGRRPGRDFVCATHENGGTKLLHPYHGHVIRLVVDPNEMAEYVVSNLLSRLSNARRRQPKMRLFEPRVIRPQDDNPVLISYRRKNLHNERAIL